MKRRRRGNYSSRMTMQKCTNFTGGKANVSMYESDSMGYPVDDNVVAAAFRLASVVEQEEEVGTHMRGNIKTIDRLFKNRRVEQWNINTSRFGFKTKVTEQIPSVAAVAHYVGVEDANLKKNLGQARTIIRQYTKSWGVDYATTVSVLLSGWTVNDDYGEQVLHFFSRSLGAGPFRFYMHPTWDIYGPVKKGGIVRGRR